MNKKLIRKMLTASGGPLFPWQLNTEWINDWKFRTTPVSRSRVLSGKGVETDKQYTERRKKETTKRTWRSDAADIAHGIGEGILALNPYTAIPYFGAKVGLDFLNGNVSWQTALNASVPLFHLSPQAVGLKEATNVALEDAANAGSKTARNWRVAREIKLATKNKPNLSNRTVSSERSVNGITGVPEVQYILYNEFGEPIGLTNIGGATLGHINRVSKTSNRMVDGIYSKNKAHKVSEDTYNVAIEDILNNGGVGLESGWSLMSPEKTMATTSKFPYLVIGHEFGNPVRLLTGTTKRPIPQRVQGNHYIEIKPKTEIKFNEATGEFEEVPTTLSRLISLDTYPLYRGPLFSIKSIVNSDGTVNPRQAMKVLHTIADWFGNKAHRMESRLENPEWHKTDPTTFHHTKLVAQSAWRIPTPLGFTKYDQMVAALGHDFGKIVSGDGHAQIGADLAKLIFPDMTEALYKAIAEHMGVPVTSLGKATKMADMRNGIVVRDINGKTRILLPTHTDVKPREIVIDPQGDNKYYVHMRVWDDVGKHVPGNISDIEKGNLFQTLYESLPDNAEILFPKSGPGNYGTRGTVAGLQRLSRDPRFTPGTKGTLQYLDKDGKTIKTYEGTSFIKTPKLQSLKQGGKMNILEFLKNGSGIHIKEKNKGKFTSYCGGKVTDECILKGKNSSNPAIRKRATFAANARKWKHKEGGSIEKLEKGSWINKINESGLGKTLLEGGLSFLLNSSQNKSIAGAIDVAKAELDKEKQEASDYALLMATKKALEMLLMDPNNPNAFGGSIVLNYIRLQLYNEYLNSINLDIANRKALLDMLSLQMLSENTSGAISGIIQSGLGVVGNLLGGKKDTSSTNSTTYNGTSSSTKSIVLPKLTSNKWTPSTSLSNPVLGNNALGSMPNYTSLLNVKK